jgi:hypothetical protein
MQLYLVKGYLDVAATSLADAQALYTALLDPADADNAAAIDRITGKLETLVQSDTGEPLVISSIDDAAGTISSWVTDASTTLIAALGDPDTNNNAVYASSLSFSISGSTRVGTLALNTTNLAAAVSRGRCAGPRGLQPTAFTLQLTKTTSSLTETMAMLRVRVLPAVATTTPIAQDVSTYPTTAVLRVGYTINLGGVTSLTGGGVSTLDGQDAGSATFPVGCIVETSNGDVSRRWKLKGTYIAATDLPAGLIKPTNSDAVLNPVHWKLI